MEPPAWHLPLHAPLGHPPKPTDSNSVSAVVSPWLAPLSALGLGDPEEAPSRFLWALLLSLPKTPAAFAALCWSTVQSVLPARSRHLARFPAQSPISATPCAQPELFCITPSGVPFQVGSRRHEIMSRGWSPPSASACVRTQVSASSCPVSIMGTPLLQTSL